MTAGATIVYGEGSPSPYIEAERGRPSALPVETYGEGSPSPYIEAFFGRSG